jgi:hypothetical protein
MNIQAANIANEVIQLYEQYGGSEYAGEKVTQLEHMVQAARKVIFYIARTRRLYFQRFGRGGYDPFVWAG